MIKMQLIRDAIYEMISNSKRKNYFQADDYFLTEESIVSLLL